MHEQREGYCKLSFRLQDLSAQLPDSAELVAAYLTYRRGAFPTVAADWLISQKFLHSMTLERYSAKKIMGDFDTEGVTEASVDETYSMLNKHFGAPEADLPCRDRFERALCVRSDNGEPLGILYMGQTRVVAVSPEARGMGIGGKMYRAFAAESKNAVFHEWIRPDNTASIAMFQKLGFAKGDMIADLYIRRNTK